MSLTANLPPDLSLGPVTALGLFQYGLPALLGYTLYVGIAGRFGPARPTNPIERPGWFLGVWVALSVAGITGTAMHFAHGLPLEAARELFLLATAALGAALVPGCIAWLVWTRSTRSALERAPGPEAFEDDPFEFAEEPAEGPEIPETFIALGADPGTAQTDVMDETETETETEAEAEADAIDDAAPMRAFVAEAVARAAAEPEAAAGDAGDVHYVPIASERDARRALEQERQLREQTEKHLQVTRRALYSLDAASREDENERADSLIALETELEAHVRRSSAAEARATHEECERVRAETNASRLKSEVLRLRSDLRRGAEARARAVATAGKSVAFARRTLQARASLEDRLRETEEALANRQETISSLIRALESEKERTEEMVCSRARQLVLHERQTRERRSLEEVARSVEGKLSTRLVKKVARARPLAG